MRYSFVGKNVDITENFREKIIKKLDRISKLFPEDAETVVTLTDIKQTKKIDVTVALPTKRLLKAEVTADDIMAGLDEVLDILEGQMVKYKNRLYDKAKRSQSFADELHAVMLKDDDFADEQESSGIVKYKKISVKPMDPEEAVMQMEMLGHSFFVFRNADTDEVNVVYKRNDGAYALIEPEY